jgi:serine/threonine-protein kinase HipA
MADLDIYSNETLVGMLTEEAKNGVFTYSPDARTADLVSLLLPVRRGSYTWPGGIMPSFQMNLPEGYKKDVIRQKLGPTADVSDMGLLLLTGANTIGRVRAIPHGFPLKIAKSNFDMATLLASPDARDNLLKHLESGITEGVSGVMPKTLAKEETKATLWTDNFILKTGPVDLPGLSINEYLCLEVARNTDLDVPETHLSDDGHVLAVKRFDLISDHSRLGVEDFCALKGFDPFKKYQGSLEDLAKLANQYFGEAHRKDSKRKLFQLMLLNYALRNADAHMKNYAMTYTSQRDARLSPVYDIVTVTAYDRYSDDIPALTLKGKKVWRCGKTLAEFGSTRLSLSRTEMNTAREQIESAVQKVLPLVSEYAERYDEFKEVGKRMLDAWGQGIEDIKPDAKPSKNVPAPLREQVGLSAPHTERKRKRANPYVDPDGAFGHKAR